MKNTDPIIKDFCEHTEYYFRTRVDKGMKWNPVAFTMSEEKPPYRTVAIEGYHSNYPPMFGNYQEDHYSVSYKMTVKFPESARPGLIIIHMTQNTTIGYNKPDKLHANTSIDISKEQWHKDLYKWFDSFIAAAKL